MDAVLQKVAVKIGERLQAWLAGAYAVLVVMVSLLIFARTFPAWLLIAFAVVISTMLALSMYMLFLRMRFKPRAL